CPCTHVLRSSLRQQLPSSSPYSHAAHRALHSFPTRRSSDLSRKRLTSVFSRLLSVDNDFAADRTWADADPVSLAPRCTSAILAETCWVPCAACCTLREISCVAAPCSSTAAAIAEAISERRSIVAEMVRIAFTDSCVAAWMPEICCPISPVAFDVCS